MEKNRPSVKLKSTHAADMRIFSYVVARDFGFAPNPFFQLCTLATCKPRIREAARRGDFVVGTCPSPRVHNLVFFMEVQEIVTYDQYWNAPEFQAKKPNLYGSKKAAFGDNIYHRDPESHWIQEDSHHTNDDGSQCQENIDTDTSCENVLISRNFCYWGGNGPELPPQLYPLVKKGPGHKSNFSEEFKQEIIGWLAAAERGFVSHPFSWR